MSLPVQYRAGGVCVCVGGGSSKLYLNLRTAECGTADQQTSINHTGIFVCVPVVYPGTSTVSLPGTDTVAPTGSASATGTVQTIKLKFKIWVKPFSGLARFGPAITQTKMEVFLGLFLSGFGLCFAF